MLKVLIADDEKNICLMIQKLIDWKAYGMEVIGLVHNGIDAVRVMEEERPDVIISDIRMPGYDGLDVIQKAHDMELCADFIIISGYKYFEYAHKALNLGVEYYLLKPIDKKELEETLNKIIQKRKQNLMQAEEQTELKEQAKYSRKRIQKHFLSDIMKKSSNLPNMELNRINTEFQCEFEQGCFIAVFAKLDSDVKDQELSGLIRMVEEIIDTDLQGGDKEYINSTVESGVISIINYRMELREGVRQGIEKPFQRIRRELDKFDGYHITIGIGSEKNFLSEIADSIHEAIYAIKCRGKAGLDKVIYFNQLRYNEIPLQDVLDEKSSREIENITEALDYDALYEVAAMTKEKIDKTAFYSPVIIYDYLERVSELILSVLRTNHTDEAALQKLERDFQKTLDFYIEPGNMVYRFTEVAREFFEQVIAERKSRSQLPIRMAKQYVQDNYSQQVTLEDVAEAINLSPAYLSTMFKKEMGLGFSDFLIACRIEAAKQLLKTTALPISEVAVQVGYADSKYFSKTFNKVVGLKPSVYRKLYC